MAYATARQIALSEIPIIDLAPLISPGDAGEAEVAAALTDAAERVGFFYVRNHGVGAPLLERAMRAAHAFFALPVERKREVACSDRHRGFLEPGEARMQGARRPDLKESFVWGINVELQPGDGAGGRLLAANNWPGFMPELEAALIPYLEACNACGWRLLRAFARALDVSPDTFIRHIDRPVSRGGAIYYPPQPPDLGEEQFGVAPHTDFGCLTLLWQDEVGGLQVQGKDDGWVLAPPVADAFVVNVGDLLARWTNGRFRSTPHRVVNSAGRARYSIAVFVDPNDEQLVEPVTAPGEKPRYGPTTVGDYIRARYDASFAYRQGRRLAS